MMGKFGGRLRGERKLASGGEGHEHSWTGQRENRGGRR